MLILFLSTLTAAWQMNTTTHQAHMNTFETNIHPLKTQNKKMY